MSIVVYFSSAGGSREVKRQQNEIFHFLDGKKIIYRTLDITQSSDLKDEMRKKVGNPLAMPPQVFNGDKYCGDYQAFFNAIEDGKPETFFKL
ncbi:SH3 domain-binding glutamic acid-rich-like protein 3 [Colossoma macropomum]|uniref:SH3 domain-binding glutamic acid-rich-like protein 3 n=1 Tax=Colossoma macropomum TaxID=42526 RepID=UPI001863B0A0|nr:SH3 domain-binding glutamic acid-rich-like protein 3 [Colossoma macropomum]